MSQQQVPSIGRIVRYRLTQSDVDSINACRREIPGKVGNGVEAGDTVPLIVTAVWPNEYGEGTYGVNGQALLDGNHSLWVTSAAQGSDLGQWDWPPRT